jgi:ADP-ribosylglycohydrolase
MMMKLRAHDDADRRRGLGTLLGMAVGDAFGTTNEFSTPEPTPFPALVSGPQRDIVGAGPFHLEPGQVTDDTQMAVALWSSVTACGTFDPADVAARYIDWMSVSFDIGNQTRSALTAIKSGAAPLAAGRDVWERSGRRPAGNGSLMRTAVLAVLYSEDAAALRRATLLDSAITHADPRCMLACAAFNAAVAVALAPDATVPEVFAAATAELPHAAAAAAEILPDHAGSIQAALVALGKDLELAAADDPQLYRAGTHLTGAESGFVRVSFRLAFWELGHAPGFTDAIIDVANRGGDSDTNAAITGALLGAFHGLDAIPAEWQQRVLAAPGITGPRFGPIHPKAFMASAPPR